MNVVRAVKPTIPPLIGVLIAFYSVVTDNCACRSLVTLDAVHGVQEGDMVLAILIQKGGIDFMTVSPMRYLVDIRNVHLPASCKSLSHNRPMPIGRRMLDFKPALATNSQLAATL